MLFLKIRVDVEEKLVRKFNIVNFLEYFRFFFFGTRLYHISFVLQKDHRPLQKQNFENFKLKFRTCFLYLISIVYLRFFRNSFYKQSKYKRFFMIFHQMIVQGKY